MCILINEMLWLNKYNNAYHITIQVKPFNVKSSTYIDSSKKINGKEG